MFFFVCVCEGAGVWPLAAATPSSLTSKARNYAYVNPSDRTLFFSLSRPIRALGKFKMCRCAVFATGVASCAGFG